MYFYKDLIPNVQYINVNLSNNRAANAIGAQFSIQRPVNIPNQIWEILAEHYLKLGLITIYNELASDEITEVFNSCVSHIRCGGSNVGRFIENLLAPEEVLYGVSHWRVVLMKELSVSPDFARVVNSAV